MPFPIHTPRRFTAEERAAFQDKFPELDTYGAWVLGPPDSEYNCIAWTLGITDAWIGYPGIDLAELYEEYGDPKTASCSQIVAFRTSSAEEQQCKWTHGCVQLDVASNNIGWQFTSKIGPDHLITHTLAGIVGSLYGEPAQCFQQNSGGQSVTSEISGTVKTARDRPSVPRPPDLSNTQIGRLREKAASIPREMRNLFDHTFAAWRQTWRQFPLAASSNAEDYAKSEEFKDLVALGDVVLPLVMQEMYKPGQFFALQAAKRLINERDHLSQETSLRSILAGEQYTCRRWLIHWLDELAD